MNIKNCLYVLCGMVIIIVDRITKYYALTHLINGPHYVCSVLSYELTINRGVSWGLFHSSCDIVFTIVSLLIVLVTVVVAWYAYDFFKKGLSIIGYVCIIAGSVSNLIDRFWYCGVIDFIVVSYRDYSWPVFNVADIAIVVGVGLLLLQDNTWS